MSECRKTALGSAFPPIGTAGITQLTFLFAKQRTLHGQQRTLRNNYSMGTHQDITRGDYGKTVNVINSTTRKTTGSFEKSSSNGSVCVSSCRAGDTLHTRFYYPKLPPCPRPAGRDTRAQIWPIAIRCRRESLGLAIGRGDELAARLRGLMRRVWEARTKGAGGARAWTSLPMIVRERKRAGN